LDVIEIKTKIKIKRNTNYIFRKLEIIFMKTALACIAKNEDNYIDEWIKYHTKIGFDFIYVY
jgi:hypothetical protein